MNRKLTTRTALLSLVAASALAIACGSATDAQGEVQSPVASAPVGSAQAPVTEEHAEHGRHGHHGGMFRKFDKDGDGKVALSELPAEARERMKDADTNGDGVLTKDEVKAARKDHHAKMQAMMDTDGDGKVSDDERKTAHQKFEQEWQKRIDTNHDGVVSDEERAAAHAKFGGEHWKEKVDANRDGVVTDDEKKAAFAKFREKQLERHDANQDGALEQSEVPPRMWEHIVAADANKDGKVDPAELATLPMPEPRHHFRH